MPHKIKRVTPANVEFDPALAGKNPTRMLKPEKFGVTDRAIALVEGNEFEKGVASCEITAFGPAISRDTGPGPAIDRNPYNFVAFAGKQPWALDPGAVPAGHDTFAQGSFTGCLRFEAEALTPCSVPSGFPFAKGDPRPAGGPYDDAELREIPREFCTLVDQAGERRYAIPGASFKGALRAAVEALANSRLGITDVKKLGRHLYRRRVFTCGVLETAGGGNWTVREIEFPRSGYGRYSADNKTGLLAWFRPGKPETKSYEMTGGTFRLSKALAEGYSANIREHDHYNEHAKNHREEYDDLPDGWPRELGELHDGDVVYCAVDQKSGQVLNFGKNVNYLWPASRSIADLVKAFRMREVPKLDAATDMAEHLFGFTGESDKGDAFRGLLRFETLWGPKAAEAPATQVRLAPLTAPASQGKSRPLYLAPGANGLSASYDDANAEARGRKFYWHQRTADSQIWKKHTFAGSAPNDAEFRREVLSQCPPPIHTLAAGTRFGGAIHFTNLTAQELGAVLFALEGDGSYDHAFHLGKAKPRGLGSFRIRVSAVSAWRMEDRYRSLTREKGPVDLTVKKAGILGVFRGWCAARARIPATTPLNGHPHIQDFIKLHTWPGSGSVRYYPPNFAQYSWLPGDDSAAGEPRPPRQRPVAMSRARDVRP